MVATCWGNADQTGPGVEVSLGYSGKAWELVQAFALGAEDERGAEAYRSMPGVGGGLSVTGYWGVSGGFGEA